jgi:predicted nuclease of restriction endonuclease-like (RecB) superfamily
MAKKSVLPITPNTDLVTREYVQALSDIKQQIKEAQVKAMLAANTELIKLYWSIGAIIAEKQAASVWGTSIIEQLARDLQSAFPGLKGFSRANIFYMRAFYLAYEKVQKASGQLEDLPIFHIPWWHNVMLIKVKDSNERLWYARNAVEHGWSGNMLDTWIKSDLYHRQGKAVTNFSKTLPTPDSDFAQQSFKDPYIFDFLTLHKQHIEHDLEQGLIENVQKMLLELGKGFALIGRQYHLKVNNYDCYIDLLFYHTKLRCYVVVELKARAFDPRDAGQINFYLSVVDDQLRHPEDKPTIGLLLCKTKDNIVAEYALRDINKPIGVADYETEIMKKLPQELKSSLPTIEEIEAELAKQDMLAEMDAKNAQ